ncbi:AMP-dependent synthetase and ligase [Beggiatoa sp. PS]|nr:AMP-dependent synthetase and ligase [Beggiatoa sp. PS]
MKFIGKSTNSTGSQTNVLTDGQLTCAYRDIPEIFKKIQHCLAKKEINIEDCLVLECANSVPNALILLYLLEEGYSFLLLPKTSQGTDNVRPFLPKFCRYKIETGNVNNNGEIAHLNPEQFLHIIKNEKWIGKRELAAQKLYLRTSGSTGSPKMAVHSHTTLQGNILNCVQRLHINSDDRIAIPVPLFHMYGLGAAFLPAVAAGASIDLQKGANILRYIQREQEFNPNVVFMTPVFCETLLKGRKSPRAYKLTVAAGDRIRGDTFAKYESLFGCLIPLYGSTEMGAIAAASPDESSDLRAKTVGKPMPNVQIRLEKRDEYAEEVGELWCHHQFGFEGYVDENGDTVNLAQEYQDGWLRTKDFGRIGLDGSIEVLGRCDHSVNRNGLLVFFADVEKAIETIESIDSAIVISKGESQRGKKLIVYCVPVTKQKITEVDIRKACFDVLPQRAIPDAIFIVDSLPQLPNGKVDRQKLIKMVNEE